MPKKKYLINAETGTYTIIFFGLIIMAAFEAALMLGLLKDGSFNTERFLTGVSILTIVVALFFEDKIVKVLKTKGKNMDFMQAFGLISAGLLSLVFLLEVMKGDSVGLLSTIKPYLIITSTLTLIYEFFKKRK